MAQLKDLLVTGTSRFIGDIYGNLKGTADKAIADGNGKNIADTYATKATALTGIEGTSDSKAGFSIISKIGTNTQTAAKVPVFTGASATVDGNIGVVP